LTHGATQWTMELKRIHKTHIKSNI
jgi:hypothetical protein